MERDAPLILVSEIMSTPVRTVPAAMPIDVALRSLEAHGWTGAPVVDEDGRIVGMLSVVDVVRVLALAAFHATPAGTVASHVTPGVITIHPSADVFVAAKRMLDEGVRRLVVVEEGKLVGLVTLADVAKALLRVQAARDAVHMTHKAEGAAWDPEQSALRDRRKEP